MCVCVGGGGGVIVYPPQKNTGLFFIYTNYFLHIILLLGSNVLFDWEHPKCNKVEKIAKEYKTNISTIYTFM